MTIQDWKKTLDQLRFPLGAGIALALAALLPSMASAGTSVWVAGPNGAGACQNAVAVDRADGSLYIPDYEVGRLLHYSGTGTNLGNIGPSTNYQSVASAPGGGVYALDFSGTVRRYSSSGTVVGSFPLGGASRMASDRDGNLYALDTGSAEVKKYDSSGSLITAWGSAGDGPGQFNFYRGLYAISADSAGNVFVSDANERVQQFTTSGSFVRQWGSQGSAPGQFNGLIAVWADDFGHVYTGDSGGSQTALKRFTVSGDFQGASNTAINPYQVSALAGDGENLVFAINCKQVYRFELREPDVNPQFVGQPVVGAPATVEANAGVPFGKIVKYEFDLDNNGSYEVSGESSSATVTYNSVGPKTVGVRVTSELGGVATGTATKSVVPDGPIGVTINDGDYATNSDRVRINAVWPAGATGVTISNDGGFKASGGTRSFPLAESIAWTLRSQAGERMTRIVYLRFDGGPLAGQNYSDDIVLDTTVPVLGGASLASRAAAAFPTARTKKFKVRVRASQRKSGVSVVRVGASKKSAIDVRLRSRRVKGITKLNRVISVSLPATPRFVRVQSAAGSWSKWRSIR